MRWPTKPSTASSPDRFAIAPSLLSPVARARRAATGGLPRWRVASRPGGARACDMHLTICILPPDVGGSRRAARAQEKTRQVQELERVAKLAVAPPDWKAAAPGNDEAAWAAKEISEREELARQYPLRAGRARAAAPAPTATPYERRSLEESNAVATRKRVLSKDSIQAKARLFEKGAQSILVRAAKFEATCARGGSTTQIAVLLCASTLRSFLQPRL